MLILYDYILLFTRVKCFTHSVDRGIVKHSPIKSQSHLEVLSVFCFLAIKFFRCLAPDPQTSRSRSLFPQNSPS